MFFAFFGVILWKTGFLYVICNIPLRLVESPQNLSIIIITAAQILVLCIKYCIVRFINFTDLIGRGLY